MAAAILVARRRSVTTSITTTFSSCITRCYLLISNNDYNFCSRSPFYYVQSLHHFSTGKKQPTLVFTEDYFVSKYKFSPGIASKLASASARLRKPQNADLFLSFLQQSGFSNSHLERIIRHHTQLLSTSSEKSVKPKLKIFQQDLGLSAAEAAEILARDCNILHYQPKRIIHSLDVYRRLLGSNDLVVELIKKRGCLLYVDPEKTILPNIEFLKECGVQTSQINSCIYSYTNLFSQSPENLRRCVHKVDEMGVERTSKMFIYAVWAVCSMSDQTLKLKLKSFQDLGFSEDDILRMFRSSPIVIAVSTRKLTEVKEVLLETGKYHMSSIVSNPTSLMISVEKRYKPRLQVLKALEEKSLIDKWPGLATLYTMSDKRFLEKFVAPNISDVGEDFIAMTAARGNEETGLKTRLR